MTICGMSAFAVAIGGKADMTCCAAYIGFDPKRTSAFNHNVSSSSGANGSRHVADLHLLLSIDEKMIETFDAN